MDLFRFWKVNFEKLEKHGFKKVGDKFRFETEILNAQFQMIVLVSEAGEVFHRLIDRESQDEYVLHLMENSVGEFVGDVRNEVEKVFLDIREKCFEKEIFKSKQSKEIIEYISKTYGDSLEFLWEKFPNNAIWRRKDNQKWYALLVTLPKNKLGAKSDEIVDILDLRIKSEKLAKVVDNVCCFEAYHMNKKHWFTICLDGGVPTDRICEWIDESYALAKKK